MTSLKYYRLSGRGTTYGGHLGARPVSGDATPSPRPTRVAPPTAPPLRGLRAVPLGEAGARRSGRNLKALQIFCGPNKSMEVALRELVTLPDLRGTWTLTTDILDADESCRTSIWADVQRWKPEGRFRMYQGVDDAQANVGAARTPSRGHSLTLEGQNLCVSPLYGELSPTLTPTPRDMSSRRLAVENVRVVTAHVNTTWIAGDTPSDPNRCTRSEGRTRLSPPFHPPLLRTKTRPSGRRSLKSLRMTRLSKSVADACNSHSQLER